jgi:hypothetical protein
MISFSMNLGLGDFAEERSKRPAAANEIAALRVVVREHIAARALPDHGKQAITLHFRSQPARILTLHTNDSFQFHWTASTTSKNAFDRLNPEKGILMIKATQSCSDKSMLM